jgi:hypothetical protein
MKPLIGRRKFKHAIDKLRNPILSTELRNMFCNWISKPKRIIDTNGEYITLAFFFSFYVFVFHRESHSLNDIRILSFHNSHQNEGNVYCFCSFKAPTNSETQLRLSSASPQFHNQQELLRPQHCFISFN